MGNLSTEFCHFSFPWLWFLIVGDEIQWRKLDLFLVSGRNCKCAGARFQLRHRKPETMVAMNMMILTYRIQTYLISNQVMIICKNYTVGIIYHRLYLPDLVYLNKYYGFQEASLQKSS